MVSDPRPGRRALPRTNSLDGQKRPMIVALTRSTERVLAAWWDTRPAHIHYFGQVAIFSLPTLLLTFAGVSGPVMSLAFVWTMIVASVFVMDVTEQVGRRHTIDYRISLRRFPWSVSRYLMTNVYSTIIFWVPVGGIYYLRSLLPPDHPATTALALLAVLTALWIHCHTLLGPYLSLYGGLSPWQALITSCRIANDNFAETIFTFVLASAIGLIPTLLALALGWLGPVSISLNGLDARTTYLSWVSIEIVRPFLVPALHRFFRESWDPKGDRSAVGSVS